MRDLLDDEGLGLTEIVVSMFMLALLAIAFLPVLITGVQATDRNAVAATANLLANDAIESVRSGTFANCNDLLPLRGATSESDGRGGMLEVVRTVTCADGDGRPETVTVAVRQSTGDRPVLARATTFVMLRSST